MHLRSLFVTLSELFYTVGVRSISLAICTSFAVLCINVVYYQEPPEGRPAATE